MCCRLLLCVLLAIVARGEDEKPITEQDYRVFRGDGSSATLDELIAKAKDSQAVFLGESHDDPVAHHLEIELFKKLAGPGTVLSLEMFERDVQSVLDEYLTGLISEDHLLLSGRAWKNYKTDYRALIEFAKEQSIPVIAANAPRRYVNRVARMGKASLDELSPDAKRSLPPLPYADASPEYAEQFRIVMEEMKKETEKNASTQPAKSPSEKPQPPRDPRWQLEAQSLWDASMAYSIAEALLRQPASRIVHVNGSFHTEKRLGILDHLARYRPDVRTLVVTMRPEKSFPAWDVAKLANAGDFVVLTNPAKAKVTPKSSGGKR